MKKLTLFVMLMILCLPINAFAGFVAVEKLTDTYALRANGELVKYKDTENNMLKRIDVGVVDFNDFVYIKEDGGLYTMTGEKLAADAKKAVTRPVYTDGVYNGQYAYIAKDGSLVLPESSEYSKRVISKNVAECYGNLVIKEDGTAVALIWDGTNMTEKTLVSNAQSISGNEGEYFILDTEATCWFVPIKDGKFLYSYEVLKLEENVTCLNGLDGIVSGSTWHTYDRAALASGNVIKSVKAEKMLFAYGDHVYIDSSRNFGCFYNGKENDLVSNIREAYQYEKGSMNGYFLDQADSLYRNEQDGNNLTSTEVGSPYLEIVMAGDGWAITKAQDGTLYGIDKATGFGTGKIEENTGVTAVLLPLSQTTTFVYVNEEQVNLTRRIIERDGRTLYPLREICEILGAEVSWDSENGIAQATLGENTVKFNVGEGAYELNGERHLMDVVSIIDELTQSTYVPLRYIAEALEFDVQWTGGYTENIINITSAP